MVFLLVVATPQKVVYLVLLYTVRLEARLQQVADWIDSHTHVDIGSDHALLPLYLLQNSKIQHAIVVEKNTTPYHNACQTLAHYPEKSTIVLGDGLSPLTQQVDSLSMCGMGAKLMVNILTAHPERVPKSLILQPNDSAYPLRAWATEQGFGVVQETYVQGFWRYSVLHLQRGVHIATAIPETLALHFGAMPLEEQHPILKEELLYQQERLRSLAGFHNPKVLKELARVQQALYYF